MQKSPRQKWNEQILAYRKKCQEILSISKSIRYAGLINEYGRTLTGVLRPGLVTLLSDEAARNEFFLVSTLLSMRRRVNSALGAMDYVMFKHNKVTLIALQRKEGFYYISMSNHASSSVTNQIILKIKKLV